MTGMDSESRVNARALRYAAMSFLQAQHNACSLLMSPEALAARGINQCHNPLPFPVMAASWAAHQGTDLSVRKRSVSWFSQKAAV